MEVEEQLAELALNGKFFQVMLPEEGIYTPVYYIDPTELDEGVIVGHVMLLPQGPTFIISRVKHVGYKDDAAAACQWPSYVLTEPILHSWDKRKVEDLEIPEFHLRLSTIQCILRHVE